MLIEIDGTRVRRSDVSFIPVGLMLTKDWPRYLMTKLIEHDLVGKVFILISSEDFEKHYNNDANKCILPEMDCMTATRKRPKEIVNFLG